MMTRNLKAMGLALLCALALGALGAQSASAVVEHTFTSSSPTNKTVLTATTEPGTKEVFTLTGNPGVCSDISYRATVEGNAVDHITVVPLFANAHCEVAGSTVTLHNNGCTYTFDSDTNTNASHFAAGIEHASTSLVCGDGGSVVITCPGCSVAVGDTHPRRSKCQPECTGTPLRGSPQPLRW